MRKRNILTSILIVFLMILSLAPLQAPRVYAQEVFIPKEITWTEELDLAGPFNSLNPLASGVTRPTMDLIYEGLAYYDDATGELEGWLAESWEWSNDYNFVIHIRPEAHFRKGRPVTAEDVIFSIQIFNMPEYGISATPAVMEIVDSMRAIDEKTVCITLKEGHPRDILVLDLLDVNNGIRILPKYRWSRILNELGPDILTFTDMDNLDEIDGSGPYTPYYITSTSAYYKRVDTYWGNSLGWYFVPEYYQCLLTGSTATAVTLLQSYAIDYAGHGFGVSSVDWVKNYEYLGIWNKEPAPGESMCFYQTGYAAVVPNYEKLSVVRNLWLREALAYAINYDELVEKTATGFGFYPLPSCLFTGTPSKYINVRAITDNFITEEHGGIVHLKYDPQKAIEILREHCTGSVKEGWTYDGEKIGNWEILAVQGWTVPMMWAEMVAKYWSDIGIPTRPRFLDYGAWDASIRVNRDFDWTWAWLPSFATGQAEAKTFYNNWLRQPPDQWAGNLVDYPKFFSGNYPPLPNTSYLVSELVSRLWSLDRNSEEYINIVHQIQDIIVPQLPIIPLMSNGAQIIWCTKRWVNWPTEDDMTECVLRNAAPEVYLAMKSVYPRAIETISVSVSPGIVESGESATVSVTLRNTGDYDYLYPIYVQKGPARAGPGPEILAHKAVLVPAGRTVTAKLNVTIITPGSYVLTVDDWRVSKFDPGEPQEITLIVKAPEEYTIKDAIDAANDAKEAAQALSGTVRELNSAVSALETSVNELSSVVNSLMIVGYVTIGLQVVMLLILLLVLARSLKKTQS